jgi:hypothetical protein
MPEWIMGPVGVGVLNKLPGTVFVPVTVIKVLGIDPAPTWHVSQLAVDGMCDVAPCVVEGGMTTIEVMPVKLALVIPCPWQVTQPVVMPLWLNNDFVNSAPLTTGNCRLLPAPTWQTSQAVVPNGTCLAGGAMMVKPMAGIA